MAVPLATIFWFLLRAFVLELALAPFDHWITVQALIHFINHWLS